MRARRLGVTLFATAVAVLVATWFSREAVLGAIAVPLAHVPTSVLRRLLLGIVHDLPLGAAAVAACFCLARLVEAGPRACGLLTLLVWLLDVGATFAIAADMRLVTDPLVVAGRLAVLGASLAGVVRASARRAAEQGPGTTGNRSPPGDRV